MPTTVQAESPRERILRTAADLFYRNGFRATGINEVIKEAGVAKATFYAHFPSKDDLCLAYLKDRNAHEAAEIMAFVNAKRTPLTRFYAVMESMEPWAITTNFRGCQFINMVPEVPDHTSALRKEGTRHFDWGRDLIHKLASELIDSDKKKYRHLNANELADAYMTNLARAVALAGVYNDLAPIKNGIKAVHQLVP